jgi:hypothetical protein
MFKQPSPQKAEDVTCDDFSLISGEKQAATIPERECVSQDFKGNLFPNNRLSWGAPPPTINLVICAELLFTGCFENFYPMLHRVAYVSSQAIVKLFE